MRYPIASEPGQTNQRRILRSRPIRVLCVGSTVGAILLFGACTSGDPAGQDPPEVVERSFDFEEGMEGWEAAAADTLDPPIQWHVRHTTDVAHGGAGAVELHMENLNDAGKIWMERPFELEPGVTYDVDVSYAFGTADWGDINLFTVIAGVHPDPPRGADELTFQDETGHGQGQGAGLVWQARDYEFVATAPPGGLLWVTIGVWGTWETTRTYAVDDVTVRFSPVTGG